MLRPYASCPLETTKEPRTRSTANRFVNDGAYVFVTGRRDAELTAALKEIGAR